jgi:hypothetical protein
MQQNGFFTTYSNTNQNHPLQQNSQNYLEYKKFVSINSNDRDILSFPNSNEFEIELPEDINNVAQMNLQEWAFPSNYDTFSSLTSNVTLIFKVIPYDYSKYYKSYPLDDDFNIDVDIDVDDNSLDIDIDIDIDNISIDDFIYQALKNYNKISNGEYTFDIEEGFYTPTQLATELQNNLNATITTVVGKYITEKLTNKPIELKEVLRRFVRGGAYNRFVVVYNAVSQNLWFGNRADSFELLNSKIYAKYLEGSIISICKKTVPEFSKWGLPYNLGFTRCNVVSKKPKELNEALYENILEPDKIDWDNYVIYNNYIRFYYGEVENSDGGFWLIPANSFGTNFFLKGAIVEYIECPYKINIFGEPYIYMEIFKYNCLDETQPYNISNFTLTTNETNGVVNSAFAKIPVVSTPLSQYYDGPCNSYKFFDPPIEKIRRLRFRIRYHNGQLVNFGLFEYSFTIAFTTLLPMINRVINISNLKAVNFPG